LAALVGGFDVGRLGFATGLVAVALLTERTHALETDQFYAWKRPLADATDAINEKINAEIEAALARVSARHGSPPCPCRTAYVAIREQFDYPIFGPTELWARKTSLVERVPSSPGEYDRFRRSYLYRQTSPLDTVRWMPPSPTIEIAGVRVGTDKISHFLMNGPWLDSAYRAARKRGVSEDEATRHAMALGIFTERTVLGVSSSGILSLGDLEANYRGFLFFRGLCDGPDAGLTRTADGWRLTRPFDLRDYVTPEWDESWQPNIYAPSRWTKVKPVMEGYCALLQDPEIQSARAAYAARDRETPTEVVIRELVAAGTLADPRGFTIEAVCRAAATAAPLGSDR